MKIIPEQVIQQECYNWFNNTYCLKHHNPSLILHSVPNGIGVKCSKEERIKALDLLNKMGQVKGISDLIIHGVNGFVINAECKALGEVQSPYQIAIEKKINKLGGVYFIFRSLDEFKLKIEPYLNRLLGKE